MPQSVTMRLHSLITLALTDLATVKYSGGDKGAIYFKNTGPGKVYLSFDPTVPAAVANVNTVLLATGDTFTMQQVARNTVFTMIADTASTIVTCSQLSL
jgi:hypothetical protein